jgi:hypothetical protein
MEELLTVILKRLDKLDDIPTKREIGSNLNGEASAAAKLKMSIPLIPIPFFEKLLTYEQEFAFSTKEPLKTWKDLWKALVKPK